LLLASDTAFGIGEKDEACMNLSVIYLTNRKFPKAEWFFSSLRRELREEYEKIQIIIVDFWADDPGRKDAFRALAGRDIDHTTPKPTPWQGKHRIIDHDAFAAGNARNTGFILAKHPYVAFVDDVSVLVNGWLDAVRDGMNNYRIIAGVYRKVKELQVDEKGNLTHWIPFKPGNDHRFDENRKEPVPCPGDWFYDVRLPGRLKNFLRLTAMMNALMGFHLRMFAWASGYARLAIRYGLTSACLRSKAKRLITTPMM
jgi:glycosyltransferase involved in cell wall biosynthesis